MYPGPEKSDTNHKRGICADGVKSKPTPESPELPQWPQPQGVFSAGSTFHAQAFLQSVQDIYHTITSRDEPRMLLVEAQAFVLMLAARTVVLSDADGSTVALFKLYPGFKVDGSVPAEQIVKHDGADCLRVNYLEQAA